MVDPGPSHSYTVLTREFGFATRATRRMGPTTFAPTSVYLSVSVCSVFPFNLKTWLTGGPRPCVQSGLRLGLRINLGPPIDVEAQGRH